MQAVIDRIVQYPNRYQLTNVETQEVLGTFDFDEVTGTVQQVGTEIDAELFQTIADDLAARVKLSGGELKDTVVTFSDISGTAANVASGDTSATLWGKVKNWFSRLKALAFKSKVAAGDFEAGAIKNEDVADDAAIAQSKINGLESALDAKANDADLAAIAKSGDLADATQDATHRVVTDTEKAAWNAKQNAITGAASTIASQNLTDNRAIISDSQGKVAVSPVTTTELGYLDGVKSNIQEQLDNISSGTGFVSTSPQTLNDSQQTQARENIGAASKNNLDKALYNLAPTDTVVTDSDDTVTVTRNRDGVTYTETLPADVPLNQLDQNMTDIVRDEVEKTLNLFNASWEQGTFNTEGTEIYIVSRVRSTKIQLDAGTYCISLSGADKKEVYYFSLSGEFLDSPGWLEGDTFTLPETRIISIACKNNDDSDISPEDISNVMLTKGSNSYPYVPYSGQIVHQGDPDMEFATSEWKKTLNLADWDGTEDYTKNQNTWTYLFIARLSVGVNYHLTIKNFSQNSLGHGGLFLVQSDTPNIPVPYQSLIGNPDQIVSWEYSPNGDKTADFTPSKEYVCLGIGTDGTSKTFHVEDIMLVEGSHAYPYQPYNGAIVHEKQLDDALEDYLPLTGGTINGTINATGQVQEAGQRVYSPNNPQTTIAHADNATKATQDSDGNTIIDTYQKVHHLYEHKITLAIGTASVDAIYAHLTWYSNKQEAYTREEFLNEFRSAGIYSTYDLYPATGRDDSNIGREKGFAIIGICPGSAESIYFYNSVGQYFLWRLSDKLALMFDDPRIIF